MAEHHQRVLVHDEPRPLNRGPQSRTGFGDPLKTLPNPQVALPGADTLHVGDAERTGPPPSRPRIVRPPLALPDEQCQRIEILGPRTTAWHRVVVVLDTVQQDPITTIIKAHRSHPNIQHRGARPRYRIAFR
jgi:hypothetical protein